MNNEADLGDIVHAGVDLGDPHIAEYVKWKKKAEHKAAEPCDFLCIPCEIRFDEVSKHYKINKANKRLPPGMRLIEARAFHLDAEFSERHISGRLQT